MAQNHITGSGQTYDLLEQLTTDQLREQIEYWKEQSARARERFDRDIAVASKVLSRRHLPVAPATLLTVHLQSGYGAHKRGEHCEVCYPDTGKIGLWRADYSDGSQRFFCADHVSVPFAADAASVTQSTH